MSKYEWYIQTKDFLSGIYLDESVLWFFGLLQWCQCLSKVWLELHNISISKAFLIECTRNHQSARYLHLLFSCNWGKEVVKWVVCCWLLGKMALATWNLTSASIKFTNIIPSIHELLESHFVLMTSSEMFQFITWIKLVQCFQF